MFLLKKLSSYLFTLFCIIVCSYQLYYTTIEYLKFNVITLIDIDFPEWFTVPDTTLCVQFADAVNWTAWAVHHPNLLPDNCTIIDDNKENRANHIHECFEEMGADEFEGFIEEHFAVNKFYQLVIKGESLFEDITIFTKIGNFNALEQNREIFCTSRTYLRDPHVCYHVACRNATNSNYIQFNRSRLIHPPNPGSMYNLILNYEIVKLWDHVFVYIHSPLDLPRGPSQSYAVIKPRDPSVFFISFIKIKINLLEPPYATNCKNYHDSVEGIRSENHMYEKCLNSQTLKLDPSFVMYQTMIENPQEIGANFSNRLRYKHEEKLNEIRTECLQLIRQPECKSFHYLPNVIGTEHLLTEDPVSLFIIMAPTDPDIKLEKSPAFLLESFVVNIGSILGIWFGFSMVHHLGSLINHTLKIKNIITLSNNKRCIINPRLKRLFMKSVNNNGEQMHRNQNTVESLTNSYQTYGLLSRARAVIGKSHWISASRRF